MQFTDAHFASFISLVDSLLNNAMLAGVIGNFPGEEWLACFTMTVVVPAARIKTTPATAAVFAFVHAIIFNVLFG